MGALRLTFLFLDGPADVLRASVACHRWRALASDESLWRVKLEREGISDKARAFELDKGEASSMAFYASVHAEQGHQMRDGSRSKDGIQTAVEAWIEDKAAARLMYGPIASWDVSKVVNMRGLFYMREGFSEDISRWDVSSVDDMSHMFNGAASFNGDLSSWNVSNVVRMNGMFNRATSFNGDLSGWDVSSVGDMVGMFQDATSFNADLDLWNMSSVVNMFAMFANATSFDRQLSKAWLASTAQQNAMFYNSPGTIKGRIKDARGTAR